MIYQTEKQLKEFEGKIPAELKTKIEASITSLRDDVTADNTAGMRRGQGRGEGGHGRYVAWAGKGGRGARQVCGVGKEGGRGAQHGRLVGWAVFLHYLIPPPIPHPHHFPPCRHEDQDG